MRPPLLLLVAALVSALSCGPSRYVYAPTRTTGAEVSGATAASYAIPPDSPRGRVRVAVVGVLPLEPGDSSRRSGSAALLVAIMVVNRSDATWTVVPSEQRIELTHERELVVFSGGAEDTIEIPAGATRRVELAFPLPGSMDSAGELPALNVVWVVRAGSRVVVQRTPFERFLYAPLPAPRMPLSPAAE